MYLESEDALKAENVDEHGNHEISDELQEILWSVFDGTIPQEQIQPWFSIDYDQEQYYYGISVKIDGQTRNFMLIHTTDHASTEVVTYLIGSFFRPQKGIVSA